MSIDIGDPSNMGTNSVIPKINVMLIKLLPTMLPKASDECPLKKAFKLKLSSGRLVPKAIMVAPINDSGIPIDSAMTTADSTRK